MSKLRESYRSLSVARSAFVVAILLATLMVPSPAKVQSQGATIDAWAHRQRGIDAIKAGDYQTAVDNLQSAVSAVPDHPGFIYYLAAAEAMNRQPARAIELLNRLAHMGLAYHPESDEHFASLKSDPGFTPVLDAFAANARPLIKSEIAFTLSEKGLVTEGVAYDAKSKNFFVSSVRKRKVVLVDRNGNARDFATERDGLWSAMGLQVDESRRALYVCSTATPQMIGAKKALEGKTELLRFDLATGHLIKRYSIEDGKPHWFGKLTLSKQGDLYIIDRLANTIYRLKAGAENLEPVVTGPFRSATGIAVSPDGKWLYAADYSWGLFVVDLNSKTIKHCAPLDGATLLGIDGLYYFKGNLIAIQNGIAPQRIVRLTVDTAPPAVKKLEIVESNNPAYDEPTMGVLVGNEFFYIGSSQWSSMGEDGSIAADEKLKPHTILRMRL